MNDTIKNIAIIFMVVAVLFEAILINSLVNQRTDLQHQLARMKDNECTKLGGMIFQGKCVDEKIFVELGK